MSLVQDVQPDLYGVGASVITAATAAVAYATRVNPLWLFAAGGVLGLTGRPVRLHVAFDFRRSRPCPRHAYLTTPVPEHDLHQDQ
jgi:hypothetical protein